MENNFQKAERYNEAKKRVEQIKGFYAHLMSFIIVNLGLFIFNIATLPNDLWFNYWFYWQLLFWGIGLAIHGMFVFNLFSLFGKKWEEEKIKEFISKEKKQNNKWE